MKNSKASPLDAAPRGSARVETLRELSVQGNRRIASKHHQLSPAAREARLDSLDRRRHAARKGTVHSYRMKLGHVPSNAT